MFKKHLFVIGYWLSWVIFFECTRLLFLFTNFAALKATEGDAFWSLLYGLKMDASMAAYITLPVALFVLLSVSVPIFRKWLPYFLYTLLLLLPVLLILFADAGLFKAWGNRIDATPLKYLSNPKEVWASIANLPITLIVIGFLLLLALLFFLVKRWLKSMEGLLKPAQPTWLVAITLLLLTGAFIIPLRGGFQLAPLNQSSVYYSQHAFSNQAAINSVWNFMHSVTHKTDDTNNPFLVTTMPVAVQTLDSLFKSSTVQKWAWLKDTKKNKPNVLIIVWESFTAKVVEWQKDSTTITPGFNQLIKEGIYFDNIYATGDRTDKGIVGILSGYPAQPIASIVKVPSKAAKLPMLSKTFKANKYNTSFFYGGELEFANMKAYLVQGQFDEMVSERNFEEKDKNSKWGAHDGVVAEKLQNHLQHAKAPFFTTWLTLSSHEPFEIPTDPLFPGNVDEDEFLSSLHYTDEVIFQFIQKAKQQPWWNNTLVLITGDHGHRIPAAQHKWDDFKTPLLLLGGAMQHSGLRVSEVGSQTDIAATLLAQLSFPHSIYVWSRDMTAIDYQPFAYFSFNNGFGWVNAHNKLVFDNVGQLLQDTSGQVTHQQILTGRKMQQVAYQDYLNK